MISKIYEDFARRSYKDIMPHAASHQHFNIIVKEYSIEIYQ